MTSLVAGASTALAGWLRWIESAAMGALAESPETARMPPGVPSLLVALDTLAHSGSN